MTVLKPWTNKTSKIGVFQNSHDFFSTQSLVNGSNEWCFKAMRNLQKQHLHCFQPRQRIPHSLWKAPVSGFSVPGLCDCVVSLISTHQGQVPGNGLSVIHLSQSNSFPSPTLGNQLTWLQKRHDSEHGKNCRSCSKMFRHAGRIVCTAVSV